VETLILGTFSVIATALGFYLIIDALRAWRLRSPWKLFLISTKEEDAAAEIAIAEKLIRTLAGFQKPFLLEVAVPHVGDRIHFYVGVRTEVGGKALKVLRALFGKFCVEEIHENHIIFYPHGVAMGAYLTQKEHPALPIPTYGELGADMFKDVLLALREVAAIGEGIAVQFVVQPKRLSESRVSVRSSENSNVTHVKLGEPLLEANARVVVSAGSEFRARGILDEVLSSFEKFKGQGRNALKRVTLRNPKGLLGEYLNREFKARHVLVFTSEELANLYHCSTFPRHDAILEIAGAQGENFIFPARGTVRSQAR